MATIQDMAKTAAFIRKTFEGIMGSIGDSSDARAVMCAIGDMYINVLRLDDDLREAATPSPEHNTGGGAAEKRPGGGSGNFDREGGLENPGETSVPSAGISTNDTENYVTDFGCKGFTMVSDDMFALELTVPVSVQINLSRDTFGDETRSEMVVARPPKGVRRFLFKDGSDAFQGLIEHGNEMLDEPEIYTRLWNWRNRRDRASFWKIGPDNTSSGYAA